MHNEITIANRYLDIKYKNHKKFVNYYYKKKLFYAKTLKIVSNFLNLYNNKNYSNEEWNLLVGPWLHSITSIYLNYEFNLKKFNFKSKNIKIKKIECFFDESDYVTRICDLNVNISIINFLKNNSEKQFDFKFITDKNRKLKKENKKLKILINFYMWLLTFVRCKNFHINAKFNLKDTIMLFFKSGMKIAPLPSFVHRYQLNNLDKYNFKKRSEIFKKLQLGQDLKNKMYLIISLMPKLYLEGYKELEANNFFKNYNHAKKFITSTSYIDDEIFKNILVDQKNKNKKLKIHLMQHGGHFNLFDYKIHSFHENNISQKFFSWGSKQNNYFPMPSMRLQKYLNDKKIYISKKKMKSICYVCSPLKLYDFQLDFFHNANSRKTLLSRKFFFDKIDKKFEIICRPYYEKRYTHQLINYKNLSKNKYKISNKNEFLINSKLIVFEYFSTMIFEIINLDIPFIIICNPREFKLSKYGKID